MESLLCIYSEANHRISLLDDEVSKHLVILSEGLLVVGLVVVSNKSMEHEEETGIGYSDGWHGYVPSLLNQVIAPSAATEDS